MIHFGIKEIRRKVLFEPTLYYPYSLDESRIKSRIVFGACFGFMWWKNSISVMCRPSASNIDKIDVYAYTYNMGNCQELRIASLDISKQYLIMLKFYYGTNKYRIDICRNHNIVKTFMDYFRYPIMTAGYYIDRTHEGKISIEK